MADFAPAPWSYETSGKPGGNGDFNLYVLDKDGRKIAAVWGKRGEKEATAATMMAAPEMLVALQLAIPALEWCQKQWAGSPQSGEGVNVLSVVKAALALAEGRS